MYIREKVAVILCTLYGIDLESNPLASRHVNGGDPSVCNRDFDLPAVGDKRAILSVTWLLVT